MKFRKSRSKSKIGKKKSRRKIKNDGAAGINRMDLKPIRREQQQVVIQEQVEIPREQQVATVPPTPEQIEYNEERRQRRRNLLGANESEAERIERERWSCNIL